MHPSKEPNEQAKEKNADHKITEDAMIDQTLEDTFPASDPPAWYGGKDKKRSSDNA